MKAIVLDMYGVILKETGDGFVPFVNSIFPKLPAEEIYLNWDKADVGEISSLDVFKNLGFKGDLVKTEKDYLDTIEIDKAFYEFATMAIANHKLALISNDSSGWSSYLRDKYKIDGYFSVISISGSLKIKKPDARIFKHTLDQLGCYATDCTYIDDRRYNLLAAQSLGMKTILFNSRNVEYDGEQVNNFQELTKILNL